MRAGEGSTMQSLTAKLAHAHSILNKNEITASRKCGCFYCERIYTPRSITFWTDRDQTGGRTALCPFCAVDAVIGDASGYEITEEFLRFMHQSWFEQESV